MAEIRVLHILHSMNRGGAENAIMNYYRHIDRSMVQFDFLLTEQNKSQFEDEIISLGGKVYRVPLLRMSNPFPYLKAVSSFFDMHPEYKIVHSHTSSKSFFPLWIAKRKGIPVRIAHSHGSHSEASFNGRIRDLLKFPLKNVATNYLACGVEAAKWLYGGDLFKDGKVKILPNVIECSRFAYNNDIRNDYRIKLGLSENSLLLGCTARFCYPKNQVFAVDVFKKIHDIVKNSKLILVGDGEQRAEIESRISNYGLEDSVIFTGVVSNVSDYEQAMDIYLMPSFYEGLPLSLIEAQISGLKCFVSTGIPKEVDKTGLVTFLPLSDGAKNWAEIIIANRNYVRRSYLCELKQAGYDAETSAKHLEQLYLDLYNQIHY